MKPARIRFVSQGGYTLVEMMIATLVSSSMFIALAMSFVTLEDNSINTDNFSQNIENQQRLIDYITRDIRRSTSATILNSAQSLTLTIPDQYVASGSSTYAYDAQGNPIGTLATPNLTGTSNPGYYGSSTNALSVTYSLSGSNITRQQIVPVMGASGTTSLVVATGVSSFQLDFTELTTVINFTVCFQSQLNATRGFAATPTATTISASAALRDNLAY